jgi:feruloyl-CoA synthase
VSLDQAPRYRQAHVGGCVQATVEHRPDGTLLLRSTEPLGPYPARLTDALERWAAEAPERTFIAKRRRGGPQDGEWERISYAQMLARARSIGQALVDRGLSADRPIAILSDNDLEHACLAMGAMWAGVPYVPVSPAYSLVSQDHAKLRHILATVTPGLVFAASPAYGRALESAVPADAEVVLGHGLLEGRASTPFGALLDTAPGAGVDAAHAATGPDTIAKFLFTSGSTKQPKGVVNTQRMLCANQQMLRQCMTFLADEPPVLVDWLPWNHTFGGNHNVGIVLYNGGTLYIDEGKPTPKGIAETLRNLREISPTVYFNVPKGFEEIAAAMDHDLGLRDRLFARVQAFMFAGAGLSQAVWDKLDAHAESAVGEISRRLRSVSAMPLGVGLPSSMYSVPPL